MNKILTLGLSVLVCASMAMAQTYVTGSSGIHGIDTLGAHQNGGRGCAGCHTPHSGVRGNGGALTGASTLPTTLSANANSATGTTANAWNNQTTLSGAYGNTALWGQDIGPIINLGTIYTGGSTGANARYPVSMTSASSRITSGVIFCLSCHDGNVAKGAMMTNQAYEQVLGLLPSSYGALPIPTLLGNQEGAAGNYENDHPIGPNANISALGLANILMINPATNTTVIVNTASTDPNYGAYNQFITNYGAPLTNGGGHGGFAVDTAGESVGLAYVVCTTCHNQHNMYVYNGAAPANPIGGATSGNFPTYFFIAAPYNPGANTATGQASSATQFCRQCHFTESNEYNGVLNITTAF